MYTESEIYMKVYGREFQINGLAYLLNVLEIILMFIFITDAFLITLKRETRKTKQKVINKQ